MRNKKNFNNLLSYKNVEKKEKNFLYKDFSNTDSYNVKFDFSMFKFCKFYKTIIKASNFYGCIFEWSDFRSSNFNHTRFTKAIFRNVYFGDCKLNQAHFKYAKFENCIFKVSDYKNLKDKEGVICERDLDIDTNNLALQLKNNFNIIELNKIDLQRLLLIFTEDVIIKAITYKKPSKNELHYIVRIINDYQKINP